MSSPVAWASLQMVKLMFHEALRFQTQQFERQMVDTDLSHSFWVNLTVNVVVWQVF